jgi:adenosylcobyric acid synthase
MNPVATARSLMVMGTASDVGKSVVVTGLCRLFARAGIRVAPFKSQNMSNNAAVCPSGGEIGHAQAAQAEACGLEASIDMNPVLLKPESENGCQVVIGGRPRFRMTTRDHGYYRERAWPEIVKSYQRLASSFELIVIEGAGGAAEVNLRERDVVNWRVAELADAPVFIVADIDKGGALAALVGTINLLSPFERGRVKGLIINKFRGDPALLSDGLRVIEERTGIRVMGVLPYATNLDIPEEDSASLSSINGFRATKPIKLGVVRLPRIANYTDFEALVRAPEVDLQYIEHPEQANGLDVICLPGSKSTIADLNWVRESGWGRRILDHYHEGGSVLGICAGYQMLGGLIADPHHVESSVSEASGLGILDIETVFNDQKITALVRAIENSTGNEVSGYEIHCGRISRKRGIAAFQIQERGGRVVDEAEGTVSDDGRVLGTSIHGLFDEPGFRRHYLDQIMQRKGLVLSHSAAAESAKTLRLRAYDRFADLIAANLDMSSLAGVSGLSPSAVLSPK